MEKKSIQLKKSIKPIIFRETVNLIEKQKKI